MSNRKRVKPISKFEIRLTNAVQKVMDQYPNPGRSSRNSKRLSRNSDALVQRRVYSGYTPSFNDTASNFYKRYSNPRRGIRSLYDPNPISFALQEDVRSKRIAAEAEAAKHIKEEDIIALKKIDEKTLQNEFDILGFKSKNEKSIWSEELLRIEKDYEITSETSKKTFLTSAEINNVILLEELRSAVRYRHRNVTNAFINRYCVNSSIVHFNFENEYKHFIGGILDFAGHIYFDIIETEGEKNLNYDFYIVPNLIFTGHTLDLAMFHKLNTTFNDYGILTSEDDRLFLAFFDLQLISYILLFTMRALRYKAVMLEEAFEIISKILYSKTKHGTPLNINSIKKTISMYHHKYQSIIHDLPKVVHELNVLEMRDYRYKSSGRHRMTVYNESKEEFLNRLTLSENVESNDHLTENNSVITLKQIDFGYELSKKPDAFNFAQIERIKKANLGSLEPEMALKVINQIRRNKEPLSEEDY